VAQVGQRLGIELVAGKPLIDQMRRQGRGDTLRQCAGILYKTLTSLGVDVPRSAQSHAPRERGG